MINEFVKIIKKKQKVSHGAESAPVEFFLTFPSFRILNPLRFHKLILV